MATTPINLGLPPVPAVVLLVLAIWRWRRPWSRWAAAAAVIMLYAGSVEAIERALAAGLQPPFRALLDPAAAGRLDAFVVLGGAVHEAGEATTSPTMNREAAARLAEGLRLVRRLGGTVPVVVSSGASVFEPNVASGRVMAMRLESWGLPRDRIIIEDTSADTVGSGSAVAARLNPRPRVALVTSACHMRRSLVSFKATSLQVVPAPTDSAGQGRMTIASGVPAAGAALRTQRLLRVYL